MNPENDIIWLSEKACVCNSALVILQNNNSRAIFDEPDLSVCVGVVIPRGIVVKHISEQRTEADQRQCSCLYHRYRTAPEHTGNAGS